MDAWMDGGKEGWMDEGMNIIRKQASKQLLFLLILLLLLSM
jgi:hypothetical protein